MEGRIYRASRRLSTVVGAENEMNLGWGGQRGRGRSFAVAGTGTGANGDDRGWAARGRGLGYTSPNGRGWLRACANRRSQPPAGCGLRANRRSLLLTLVAGVRSSSFRLLGVSPFVHFSWLVPVSAVSSSFFPASVSPALLILLGFGVRYARACPCAQLCRERDKEPEFCAGERDWETGEPPKSGAV